MVNGGHQLKHRYLPPIARLSGHHVHEKDPQEQEADESFNQRVTHGDWRTATTALRPRAQSN